MWLNQLRRNNIHLLHLPAHMSHILQPLDFGVFKLLKTNYSKACCRYMVDHSGRIITFDVTAGLLAEVWPWSFSPVNALSGFKKTGVYPLSLGEVCDRMLAPFMSVDKQKSPQISLYQRCYEDSYNVLMQIIVTGWDRLIQTLFLIRCQWLFRDTFCYFWQSFCYFTIFWFFWT